MKFAEVDGRKLNGYNRINAATILPNTNMIRIIKKQGESCPIIKCDICQEAITDASNAAALDLSMEYNEGAESEVLHVHKGKCDEEAKRRFGRFLPWTELSDHLIWVAHNADLSPAKMQTRQ